MMTLITMDASELKDVTSAADLTIAQSPVAWFVTRYGASSSQRPNKHHCGGCNHRSHIPWYRLGEYPNSLRTSA